MKNDKPSKQEILDCLLRSGYLLESRLVNALNEAGYFVDPNQTICDKNTGKSREIDILAEGPSSIKYKDTNVRSFFVIEATNNLYPVVLTTLLDSEPRGHIELYNQCWYSLSDDADHKIYPPERVESENIQLYCQYCAITRKKNKELMASHSEDLYSSITKMVQYCERDINEWRERKLKQQYWEVLFWRPILVFQNDILVTNQSGNSQVELLDVDSARLKFNYHEDDQQVSMIIDLVKENQLLKHLKMIANQDKRLLDELVSFRYKEKA